MGIFSKYFCGFLIAEENSKTFDQILCAAINVIIDPIGIAMVYEGADIFNSYYTDNYFISYKVYFFI